MRTPEEIAAWQLQCFGCTEQESKDGITQLAEFHGYGDPGREGAANMALASILSDVQELIERDHKEEARQYLNRVKHALFGAGSIQLWQSRR